jgi:hypothetical protein
MLALTWHRNIVFILAEHSISKILAALLRTSSIITKILKITHYVLNGNCFLLQVVSPEEGNSLLPKCSVLC